jgi:hypothetical protein
MKSSQKGFTVVEGLLIALAVGVVGFAGWYVYDSSNKTNNIYDASGTDSATKVTKKAAEEKKSAETSTTSPISDALKENAAASIESKNTAALEGYMTDNVTVVIAASEKGGSETRMEAIKDLDYLSSGTSPWNFSLPTETLAAFKAGSYSKYFGTNTIVGKSANDMVVAFGVNSAGKIDTVFMASNASLLTD